MTVKTFVPASDKQVAFIKRLEGEKAVPVAGKDEAEAYILERIFDVGSGKDLSKSDASQAIDYLLKLPKAAAPAAPAAAPAVVLTEGVYAAPDGSLLKVKQNKAKTGFYAMAMLDIHGKRLTMTGEVVKWDWVFSPGLVREVKPEWKLTKELAYELGIKYAKCLWCGRKLKAADSVLAGLGPICAKRFA